MPRCTTYTCRSFFFYLGTQHLIIDFSKQSLRFFVSHIFKNTFLPENSLTTDESMFINEQANRFMTENTFWSSEERKVDSPGFSSTFKNCFKLFPSAGPAHLRQSDEQRHELFLNARLSCRALKRLSTTARSLTLVTRQNLFTSEHAFHSTNVCFD